MQGTQAKGTLPGGQALGIHRDWRQITTAGEVRDLQLKAKLAKLRGISLSTRSRSASQLLSMRGSCGVIALMGLRLKGDVVEMDAPRQELDRES
jgi:hypothetical protein